MYFYVHICLSYIEGRHAALVVVMSRFFFLNILLSELVSLSGINENVLIYGLLYKTIPQ